ncbi:DUF922 domain-containing protein [Changchengzhania lutea]|uniref:DUF922 domain-containing protein n=1 Tax=Changchengzhania lutea TaxID=2049305 RepID=UPI00115E650E|nr:hypothetical protein [Changchengzhania lutea]
MFRLAVYIGFFLFFQKDEPVITWSESYKLSWSDFRAAPDNKTSAVATTASGITLGSSIRQTDTEVISYTATVKAHFYPDKSWYKSQLANAHVLGHEQLHYDITELFARRLRQRISKLEVSNAIKNDLRSLHLKINDDLAHMQDTYDTETNYSRNVEQQTAWQGFISQELDKLVTFKSVD